MADKIPAAAGNGPLLIRPSTWEAMRQMVEQLEIIPDPEQFDITRRGGKTFFRAKIRPGDTPTGTTRNGLLGCPFGEIIPAEDDGKALRGGIVYCGDKNFTVAPMPIVLATDGKWLVYLLIECESNRDDDEVILLPGIKTSADDVATFFNKDPWTAGPPETQYPDNENPVVSDGLGTITVPLGKLEITDGKAKFSPLGCGNITINQCGGTLSFSR